MAHFAEIDDNTVLRVLVVPDEEEHRGQEFLADDLGFGGTWLQTSYNDNLRKQYAGIGCTYDPDNDIFILTQPFPSWSLDKNHDWQPPTPRPDDGEEYYWDEDTTTWLEIPAES
jgi:hypothetical protein